MDWGGRQSTLGDDAKRYRVRAVELAIEESEK